MVDANIQDKLSWLNIFPPKDYMSSHIGPAGMILGTPKPNYANLKLGFGQYCQIHLGTTNTQQSRSIGAISLRPKNQSGSYYFMSLETGRQVQVHSNNYIPLAITDAVIDQVEEPAEEEGMPPLQDGEMVFEWSPGVPILDETDPNPNGLDFQSAPSPFDVDVLTPPVFFDNTPVSEQGADINTTMEPEPLDEPVPPSIAPLEHTNTINTDDQEDDYLDNNDPFTTEQGADNTAQQDHIDDHKDNNADSDDDDSVAVEPNTIETNPQHENEDTPNKKDETQETQSSTSSQENKAVASN